MRTVLSVFNMLRIPKIRNLQERLELNSCLHNLELNKPMYLYINLACLFVSNTRQNG